MRIRVGVTTSDDAASRWSEPLERAGFDPISLPCIEVGPVPDDELDHARRVVAEAELVVVTSSRTIRYLYPEGGMPSVPALTVGPATAAAVTAAGGVVEVTGEGDGDDLVDLVAGDVRGRRIAFPHGRAADGDRAERLRRAGAEVEAAVVYDTIPVPPGPDPVDVAVFGSPSAVEGWIQSRTFAELSAVAAIGATTRAALADHGISDPVMGERPTIPSLVAALVSRMEPT